MTIPIEKSQIAKTTAQWEAQNPVLAVDVIGIEIMGSGLNRFKRGDDVKTWNSLPYLDKLNDRVAFADESTNADTVDGKHASDFTSAPTVLYNNTSGTNVSFTLSQSAANYTYMRIYYASDSISSSVDLYKPNGAIANLQWQLVNDTGVFVRGATAAIWGASLTIGNNRDWWYTFAGSVGGATNRIYVTRVEAWN